MTINEYLKLISISVWKRIEFVWKTNNLRISETTITENLLFELWQKSPNVIFFEARDEKANGNDIAIYIETSRGYIYLPTQAKIIDKKNRYNEIHHNKGAQRNSLINHSNTMKGIPLYLLYSFSKLHNLPIYGCSYLSAHFVEKSFPYKYRVKKPVFEDFIPTVALPFDKILKVSMNAKVLKLGYNISINISEVKFYTIDEIANVENWIRVSDFVEISKKSSSKTDNNHVFSPKFTLILRPTSN